MVFSEIIIWSININNTVGFGVTEIYENSRCDYIISGGIGSTQERWVSRINGVIMVKQFGADIQFFRIIMDV